MPSTEAPSPDRDHPRRIRLPLHQQPPALRRIRAQGLLHRPHARHHPRPPGPGLHALQHGRPHQGPLALETLPALLDHRRYRPVRVPESVECQHAARDWIPAGVEGRRDRRRERRRRQGVTGGCRGVLLGWTARGAARRGDGEGVGKCVSAGASERDECAGGL